MQLGRLRKYLPSDAVETVQQWRGILSINGLALSKYQWLELCIALMLPDQLPAADTLEAHVECEKRKFLKIMEFKDNYEARAERWLLLQDEYDHQVRRIPSLEDELEYVARESYEHTLLIEELISRILDERTNYHLGLEGRRHCYVPSDEAEEHCRPMSLKSRARRQVRQEFGIPDPLSTQYHLLLFSKNPAYTSFTPQDVQARLSYGKDLLSFSEAVKGKHQHPVLLQNAATWRRAAEILPKYLPLVGPAVDEGRLPINL